MFSVNYYVKKSDYPGHANKLAAMQPVDDVSVLPVVDFFDISSDIIKRFDSGAILCSLQLINANLSVPSKYFSFRCLGCLNTDNDLSAYEELLTSFISLSNNANRFSLIQSSKKLVDINERIKSLEMIFHNCFQSDFPHSLDQQVRFAISAMENCYNSTVQTQRRKLLNIDSTYFYQVIVFSKDENVKWGSVRGKDLEVVNGIIAAYDYFSIGGQRVCYNIRNYRVCCAEELSSLITHHKNGLLSDIGFLNSIDVNVITDCLSKRFLTTGTLIAHASSKSNNVASGRVIFGNESIEELKLQSGTFILVKQGLTPADIEYISIADGIITNECSSTSHQALIAKQLNKVFLFECTDLRYDDENVFLNGLELTNNSELSIDGRTGNIYIGRLELSDNCDNKESLRYLFNVCSHNKRISLLVNSESCDIIESCKDLYFEGVGLFRSEYMPPQELIKSLLRKAILAKNYDIRMTVINELQTVWKNMFSHFFSAVGTNIVTVRTLDYPLHELFFAIDDDLQKISDEIHSTVGEVEHDIASLSVQNGMLGNRGCRFSIAYPEIYVAQINAIFSAYCDLAIQRPKLRLMFPMISTVSEIEWMKLVINEVVSSNKAYQNIEYQVGAMIETPRAAFLIDKLVERLDFVSFGTNDLTQLVWGLSREDYYDIINRYCWNGLISSNPYEFLDEEGVMPVIEQSIKIAKQANANIKVGVCGTQAFNSLYALMDIGVDYVSINASDVPYALLLSAQSSDHIV